MCPVSLPLCALCVCVCMAVHDHLCFAGLFSCIPATTSTSPALKPGPQCHKSPNGSISCSGGNSPCYTHSSTVVFVVNVTSYRSLTIQLVSCSMWRYTNHSTSAPPVHDSSLLSPAYHASSKFAPCAPSLLVCLSEPACCPLPELVFHPAIPLSAVTINSLIHHHPHSVSVFYKVGPIVIAQPKSQHTPCHCIKKWVDYWSSGINSSNFRKLKSEHIINHIIN